MATPISIHLEALPAWARDLSEKYYSQTLSMFVLHGNVRDLAPLKRGTTVEYAPLQRFLKDALFGSRDLVVFYDRGGGLSFGRRLGATGDVGLDVLLADTAASAGTGDAGEVDTVFLGHAADEWRAVDAFTCATRWSGGGAGP